MTSVFFYGTLCDPALRRVVVGAEVATRPARLPGHRVAWAEGAPYPLIAPDPDPGAVALGLLAECPPEALDRMDFYEGLWGYRRRPVTVQTEAGGVMAQVYWPPDTEPTLAGAFDHTDWAARHGALACALAQEVLAQRGHRPAAEIAARIGLIAVRAQSRLNAARDPAPATLRRQSCPGDVVVRSVGYPWAGFFAVEEYRLTHVRFAGGQSAPLDRAVFLSGDAATVLPYDPRRDRVLLIEQFRAAPFARGDANPWLLEAIAGRVDPGETPAEAARREAIEEAGVTLTDLIPLPGYYPSPGAKAEYLYPFLAIADLPDGLGGTGGLEEEGEDIRLHLVPHARLAALMQSGEINNGPLMLSLLHLAALRPELRRAQAG